MERDLDLYRGILLAIEATADPDEAVIQMTRHEGFPNEIAAGDLPEVVQDADPPKILRHCVLLTQAGLLDSNAESPDVTRTADGRVSLIVVRGLTHEGHDFLDNIRDDTVWSRTKEKTGQASLGIVKAVAEGVVKSMVGL